MQSLDEFLREKVDQRFPRIAGRVSQDKGYDYADTRALVKRWDYTLHIKSRGDEAKALRSNPRFRARRWVVERTHSWLNRFRRLLVRWEKKSKNYEAMLHIACASITLKLAGVLE